MDINIEADELLWQGEIKLLIKKADDEIESLKNHGSAETRRAIEIFQLQSLIIHFGWSPVKEAMYKKYAYEVLKPSKDKKTTLILLRKLRKLLNEETSTR